MATKKILLNRTAVVKGKHHLPNPDKIHEFDAEIVDELVDKNAGEPVMDLPGTQPDPEVTEPDPAPEVPDPDPEVSDLDLKTTLKKKNR